MRRTCICLVALGLAGCGGSAKSSSRPPAAPPVSGAPAPAEATVVGVVRDNGAINFFYAALLKANLDARLSGPGPFTLFAPSNVSITSPGPAAVGRLLASPGLGRTLLAHVVAGRHPSAQLRDGSTLRTLAGTTLRVGRAGGKVTVGGRAVLGPDVPAGNGVVEPIDGPLSGS